MGSETGTVPLIADHHDPPVDVVGAGNPVGAGRVQPPLEHVPVNDGCSGKFPITVPLIGRPCIDNKGARCHFPFKIGRLDTIQPDPAFQEQLVDR